MALSYRGLLNLSASVVDDVYQGYEIEVTVDHVSRQFSIAQQASAYSWTVPCYTSQSLHAGSRLIIMLSFGTY